MLAEGVSIVYAVYVRTFEEVNNPENTFAAVSMLFSFPLNSRHIFFGKAELTALWFTVAHCEI